MAIGRKFPPKDGLKICHHNFHFPLRGESFIYSLPPTQNIHLLSSVFVARQLADDVKHFYASQINEDSHDVTYSVSLQIRCSALLSQILSDVSVV